MKSMHRFTGSLLIASLACTPLAALAAEGKKGLNAVDAKVVGIVIDIPSAGNRDAYVDPDNAPEEKARGIGQDTDGNGGLDRGIGHTLIIKEAGEFPSIEIELPSTKGTVKFFNETKKLGGKVIDVLIKVNGSDV